MATHHVPTDATPSPKHHSAPPRDGARTGTARRRRGARCAAALAAACLAGLLAAAGTVPGCALAQIPAGMVQSYKLNSKREVPAEYDGLRGKRVAVVINADASILYERPEASAELLRRVTKRLVDDGLIREYVDPSMIEARLFATPGWSGMNKADLAKLLQGAERIVWIELQEYRLRDKGNPYVLAGLASGYVSIFETDTPAADSPALTRSIKVFWPDMEGEGAGSVTEPFVNNVLMYRLTNRVTWPITTAEQPYTLKPGE